MSAGRDARARRSRALVGQDGYEKYSQRCRRTAETRTAADAVDARPAWPSAVLSRLQPHRTDTGLAWPSAVLSADSDGLRVTSILPGRSSLQQATGAAAAASTSWVKVYPLTKHGVGPCSLAIPPDIYLIHQRARERLPISSARAAATDKPGAASSAFVRSRVSPRWLFSSFTRSQHVGAVPRY